MKYRTIVADPPWEYPEGFGTSIDDGRASGVRNGMVVKRLPYTSMTLGQMVDLPVREWADRDSFLFLWTTNRFLPDSFWLANAWDFTYRQLVIWDKGSSMSPFGGAVTPNRAEFMLVCRRGQPRLRGRWPTGSVIAAPKGSQPGTHSSKPDVFLDFVETVAAGPYLELFARRQRLGWDTWGNEALEHVQIGAS